MPVSPTCIGRMYCGLRPHGAEEYTAMVTTMGYKFSTRYSRDKPIKSTFVVRTLHTWKEREGEREDRFLEVGDVVDLKIAGPRWVDDTIELREIRAAKVTKVKRIDSLTGELCPYRKYTFEYDRLSEWISYPKTMGWDEPKSMIEPPMLETGDITQEIIDVAVKNCAVFPPPFIPAITSLEADLIASRYDRVDETDWAPPATMEEALDVLYPEGEKREIIAEAIGACSNTARSVMQAALNVDHDCLIIERATRFDTKFLVVAKKSDCDIAIMSINSYATFISVPYAFGTTIDISQFGDVMDAELKRVIERQEKGEARDFPWDDLWL